MKVISTEEDLLNDLPENYMNKEQLEFFRNKLMGLADELRSNAGETTEHLRETDIFPDPADRASIEEEVEEQVDEEVTDESEEGAKEENKTEASEG